MERDAIVMTMVQSFFFFINIKVKGTKMFAPTILYVMLINMPWRLEHGILMVCRSPCLCLVSAQRQMAHNVL